MDIDLDKAIEEFIKYTQGFDLEDENIKRKQLHSLRVMKLSEEISKDLGLDEEKIKLATLIGLLHDIGRFAQYKQFNRFNDIYSFDHGDYGVKILFEEGLIRKFIEIDKYDKVIEKAIKNHNKFEIEKGVNEIENLFSKIIRDADKLDIIFEATEMFWNGQEDKINKSIISEKVFDQINKKQLIKREKDVKVENIDEVISIIAFIFDINFKATFKILRQNDYIQKIINRFDLKNQQTKDKMEYIKYIADEYIEEKIKE